MPYKCKEKQAAAHRRYYQKNKKLYKQRAFDSKAKRRKRNREYIANYKKENPCVDCGESNIIILEFDHIKGEKMGNISDLSNSACSIKKIQAEIDKTEVVCANCHRIRTYNRRHNIKNENCNRRARNMNAGPYQFLIKVESTHQDHVKTKSGVKIYTTLDSYVGKDGKEKGNVNDFVTPAGIVRAIPMRGGKSNRPTMAFDGGDGMLFQDSLPWDIKNGDKVYFRYTSLVEDNAFLIGDEILYRVFLDDIFAVDRDGELIVQGGKVLMKSLDKDVITSDLIIIPEQLQKVEYTGVAAIKAIGEPLKGEKHIGLGVDDRVVYYTKYGKEEHDFGEHGKLVVCYQREVLCGLK